MPRPLAASSDHNRDRVLRALRQLGSATRAELGAATGLSRATISGIAAALIGDGVIEQAGVRPAQDGRGRPSMTLRPAPPDGIALVVDLGHAHVRVLVADSTGTPRAERYVAVDPHTSPPDLLATTAKLVAEVARRTSLRRTPAVAAVLSVAGSVDLAGALTSRRFRGTDPVEQLGLTALAERVLIRNDGDAGAAGEAAFGAGRGVDNFVYVKIAHGLGAGLVLGGRLYRGGGYAGNIGHVRVQDDGDVCACGNRGCLETIVSTESLLRALRPAHPERELAVADFVELMAAGDAGVRTLVGDAGRVVGRILAQLVTVLNPASIIVGGELNAVAEPLLDGIRESITRYGQPSAVSGLSLTAAGCGERAQVLGGVALAFDVIGDSATADAPTQISV